MPIITKLTIGAFCKELVLQLEPLDKLLTSWGLTEEEYEHLRTTEFFRKELTSALEEIKNMGPDAGFVTRCKIIAEDAIGDMIRILSDKTVAPETRINLFDKFTDLGRLKPSKQAAGQQEGVRGPLVTFVFGEGMKDLPKTLDITPVKELE